MKRLIACLVLLFYPFLALGGSLGASAASLDSSLKEAAAAVNINRPDLALPHLTKAVAVAPNNPTVHSLLATAYSQLEDDQRALSSINRALQLNPRSAWYYAQRAQIYIVLKRDDEAIKDAARSIELDPKHFKPYAILGRYYLNRKNYEKAIPNLDLGIKYYPRDVIMRMDKILACSKLGRWNDVLDVSNLLLKGVPGDDNTHLADYHKWRGRALVHLNRAQEAHADYAIASKLRHTDRAIHEEALAYYQKVGDKAGIKHESKCLEEFDDIFQPPKP